MKAVSIYLVIGVTLTVASVGIAKFFISIVEKLDYFDDPEIRESVFIIKSFMESEDGMKSVMLCVFAWPMFLYNTIKCFKK